VVEKMEQGVFKNASFVFQFPVKLRNEKNRLKCQIRIVKLMDIENFALQVVYKFKLEDKSTKFFTKLPHFEAP